METSYFSPKERKELLSVYRSLLRSTSNILSRSDRKNLRELLTRNIERRIAAGETKSVLNPVLKNLNTILLCVQEIGLGRSTILSVMAYDAVQTGVMTYDEVQRRFDASVAVIVRGLIRANELYAKSAAIETENFRKLLLTFAEDIRVVFIMIAERVFVMRHLAHYNHELQLKIAREASYLYAPLAHRMGLYKLKTELEDLSLRYTSPDTYFDIARKLNETKIARDKYIKDFIEPLKKELREAGLKFDIKGRTKSIYSIWNKIKKQNTPFEKIYDLFAIRVILDSPIEKEKAQCWQVYSIVTDKYQPNPKRLRDWLSIPKSNGYESLHTTVMGPEGKWVEVQIRSRRMDEIAEKGLAAHWKYKGIKSEEGMDEWLKHIRDILENPELNAVDFMDDFRLDLYDDEVFVFTPGGDLQKLKQGATVLDFAFNIHTNLGSKCVGARVNGKNVPIRHKLSNGDQVEVLTNSSQKPKQDWLNIVVTSKAKTKIKQALKEVEHKEAEQGKEVLLRRLKNWKIEYDEADITRLTKKLGYKSVSLFYQDIALEKIEMLEIRDALLAEHEKTEPAHENAEHRSANNFIQEQNFDTHNTGKSDVLIIDQNLKGIEYKLSKCCNPIYGDEVFGFVSAAGGIKIHRMDCPNAPQMINRFGYRIVQARWSGKSDGQYPISLRIMGRDDIGIVTNITSLISKETKVSLRSIAVNSVDGVFEGSLTLLVADLHDLELLVKKIKAVRGVKTVDRV
ncbi:MAG: RelA/SpoT family protein [Prevotellaceae bacterium]|jgi:GTP pyrophosphokinase|nr:RelA/SpoT family protein [Prevotellaceae bacterium]